jgi:hypothetical protein
LGMTAVSGSSASGFLASDSPAGEASSNNVAVPEPGTLAMLVASLVGAFVCVRRMRR